MLHVLFIDFLYRLRDLHGAHVNRYPSLEFHTFLGTNEVILLHDHPPPLHLSSMSYIHVILLCLVRIGLIKWLKCQNIYVVPSLARTTSKVKNATQYDLFV